eukprot:scaffold57674_cov35-Prasinocladus_malaysianus.AAC.3
MISRPAHAPNRSGIAKAVLYICALMPDGGLSAAAWAKAVVGYYNPSRRPPDNIGCLHVIRTNYMQ